MKSIRYILIDEMSFIGPKLMLQIDSRLREAMPHQQHLSFGGISIILIGDLAQLPPVMDKPLYASHTHALHLWHKFSTVVTLHTIFRQQGEDPMQLNFRAALQNLRNAEPMEADWQLLMSRTNKHLTVIEQKEFDQEIHLFATNELVCLHNRKRLKALHVPIALCVALCTQRQSSEPDNDDQLPQEVLLCKSQRVMLTSNLWIEAGLVNGSLGEVKDIVYPLGSRPPQLPAYVTVEFQGYCGPPWDEQHPQIVPIEPITRGKRTQLPLTTAWAITIHKSQGLTLDMATIDIGKTERQGLTFTAVSRVKSIQCLRVEPAFSFERYSKMKKNPYNIIRKKEEARLHLLSHDAQVLPIY
jgi:ATP-dependent exoDNAse (exonuclease V) alpha subunit